MKIAVASGGFDPIHSGHIAYLNAASKYGDKLIIALNSDEWLSNKKGQPFMSFLERKIILENLSCVDEVISFEDDDLGSCIDALIKIKNSHPKDKIIFCNGGDRTNQNTPEMKIDNIEHVFGVGGEDKLNSSSWILKNWQGDSEERVWENFLIFIKTKKLNLKN